MERGKSSFAGQGALGIAGWLTFVVLASAGATELSVPSQFAEIQQAIDLASPGDTVVVASEGGPYYESLRIDAARTSDITILGPCAGSPPMIFGGPNEKALVRLVNTVGREIRVRLENLEFDGLDRATYGIRVNNPAEDSEAILSRLELEKVVVRRCRFGIEVGSRIGTFGCDGSWGAVDWKKLGQSRSAFHMNNCAIVANSDDGVNLWRVVGEITRSLIGYNGDEGIHTTHADGMVFRHNILILNRGVNLHLHMGDDVRVENNAFVRCLVAHRAPPYPSSGGYGVVVGGQLGVEGVQLYNNLFLGSDAAGLKINPAEVMYDSLNCMGFPVRVDVRNNAFVSNGIAGGDSIPEVDLLYNESGIGGMELRASYNLFLNAGTAANVVLDETNLLGVDPAFRAAPGKGDLPMFITDPRGAKEAIEARFLGFELSAQSAAIDAGDPAKAFEDGVGLAKGMERNDVGPFGGPASDWGIRRRYNSEY